MDQAITYSNSSRMRYRPTIYGRISPRGAYPVRYRRGTFQPPSILLPSPSPLSWFPFRTWRSCSLSIHCSADTVSMKGLAECDAPVRYMRDIFRTPSTLRPRRALLS